MQPNSAGQTEAHQIEHVSADTPVDEIYSIYERDRALVIDDLAPPDRLKDFWDEVEEPLYSSSMEKDGFLGKKTHRLAGFVARFPMCHPFILDPTILAFMKKIIGRSSNFMLNTTQLIAIQPGESPGPLHRDRWAWRALPLPETFEIVVNCMWALTDFTIENGATHIIAGSAGLPDVTRTLDVLEEKDARLPDGRLLADMHTIQVEMTKGSVFIWGGAIYHAGGANRSDLDRVGMSITYVPASLRQEENMSLIAPPEVARDFPEKLQRLIGYEPGNWALGVVEDMQSPMTRLR